MLDSIKATFKDSKIWLVFAAIAIVLILGWIASDPDAWEEGGRLALLALVALVLFTFIYGAIVRHNRKPRPSWITAPNGARKKYDLKNWKYYGYLDAWAYKKGLPRKPDPKNYPVVQFPGGHETIEDKYWSDLAAWEKMIIEVSEKEIAEWERQTGGAAEDDEE